MLAKIRINLRKNIVCKEKNIIFVENNFLIMKRTLMMILSAVTVISATAQVQLQSKNIDKVVKQMTLEEKASLLVGFKFGASYTGLPTNSASQGKAIVPGAAGFTAKIDRFGIPHTVLSDGPAGLRISSKREDDSPSA